MVAGRALALALSIALPLLALLGRTAAAGDALHLRAGRLSAAALAAQPRAEASDGLRILQFANPPGAAERAAIAAAGGEILAYLPDDAYLLRADAAAAGRLAALPGAGLLVDYRPDWRLAPALREAAARAPGEALALTLSFAPGTPIAQRGEEARALGAELLGLSERAARPRLWLRAAPALFSALAALPELLWLEPTPLLADRLERVKWVVQSGVEGETPVWDRGLHGEGQILGHIDSQLNATVCWFADPEGDPFGENHRKIVYRGPERPNSPAHGTHTAGILCGDAEPISGNLFHKGIAWAARMAHSEYGSDAYDFYADLEQHHLHGARVHTNSWGSSLQDYTELCVDIDAFCHDYEESVVLVAVANAGLGGALGSPENAKSAVAVASSHIGDAEGDFNTHDSGGSGPTLDGRRKPELFAPGVVVWSASSSTPCGIAQLSGTSMACPAVAGAAALIRQYLTEGFYPTGAAASADALVPSGALLRALLMNATLPMDSLPAGYPNDVEGWGRLVLDEALYFAGDTRELWLEDQRNSEGLETGLSRIHPIALESGAEPLSITLAFTEPAGAPMAATAVVGDLDLEVCSPTGEIFLGNHFDTAAGESAAGGEPDALNGIERVLVKEPLPGVWEIRVRARRVPLGSQGYALAANGDFNDGVFSDEEPDAAFLAVDQSYPNPFRPAVGGATLRFELRADRRGELVIYDLAGRRVRHLGKGRLLAGIGELVWDGRDDAGEPVASGIYFARLEATGGVRSRAARIVLIR